MFATLFPTSTAKVYNPSMVAPTTTKSPYDPYALIEIKGVKPPATFEGGYQQKTQESNGNLEKKWSKPFFLEENNQGGG